MKITSVHIFEYDLALLRPIVVQKTSLPSRQGFLIYITADGITGAGEVAPLEGLSREPLKKALHHLKTLRPKLLGSDVPDDLPGIRNFLYSELFKESVPSVHFGIESAFVHLLAKRDKKTPAEVLGAGAAADVMTAGLLQGTPQEVRAEAERLYKEGFRAFKLKVGSKNIPLDVKKVQEVRAVTGPDARLRLDANVGWGLSEAVAFGELIGAQGIEFMEDPVRELEPADEFYKKTGIPVAFDELLGSSQPEKFTFPDGVEVCVLKPTVVGGIFKTLDWMAKAKQEGRRTVISSAFESSVGLTMLANLALLSGQAAGLGTGSWFKEDLLSAPVGPGGVIAKKSLQFDIADIKIEHLKLIN